MEPDRLVVEIYEYPNITTAIGGNSRMDMSGVSWRVWGKMFWGPPVAANPGSLGNTQDPSFAPQPPRPIKFRICIVTRSPEITMHLRNADVEGSSRTTCSYCLATEQFCDLGLHCLTSLGLLHLLCQNRTKKKIKSGINTIGFAYHIETPWLLNEMDCYLQEDI